MDETEVMVVFRIGNEVRACLFDFFDAHKFTSPDNHPPS